MEWTEEEILNQVNTKNKLFIFFKLNKITSLIPNILNQICFIDLSGFRTDFTG